MAVARLSYARRDFDVHVFNYSLHFTGSRHKRPEMVCLMPLSNGRHASLVDLIDLIEFD